MKNDELFCMILALCVWASSILHILHTSVAGRKVHRWSHTHCWRQGAEEGALSAAEDLGVPRRVGFEVWED